MRPAQMTEPENKIIESILMVEISMAVRSMGNAKDWTNQEIKMFCGQILDGFLVRSKTVSFATMLLFFKMRRARLEPCNKNTYGFNPTAILDEFNEFLDWQKIVVSQAAKPKNYEADMTKTLENAPFEVQVKLRELQIKLSQKNKGDKGEVKIQPSIDLQKKRLLNCLEMDYLWRGFSRTDAQKQYSVLIAKFSHLNGFELKQEIDKLFPPSDNLGVSVSFGWLDAEGKKPVVVVNGGDNKLYKINSGT